jgi:hypothetical protein
MGLLSLDVDDKADAASVMLELRIIQTLPLGQPQILMLHKSSSCFRAIAIANNPAMAGMK